MTHAHTNTHTTGRTPLEEGSACGRGLYLTTHVYNRETIIPPAGSNPQSQQAMATELRITVRQPGSAMQFIPPENFITSNDFYMRLDYMLESRKAQAKQLKIQE